MRIKRLFLYFLCANLFFAVSCIGTSSNLAEKEATNSIELISKLGSQTIKINSDINDFPVKSSSNLDAKTAYAIVVGISDYPGSDNDLQYSDDDALEVYDLLIDEFNFNPANVYYFIDSEACQSAISTAFDTIASKIDSNDIFFFYYSGHGGADTINAGEYSHVVESLHPYTVGARPTWTIFHTDAAYMRVHFDTLNMESGYDYVLVGDPDVATYYYYYRYTGYQTNFWSGWVPLWGDNSIYIRLYEDGSVNAWGFLIDKYEVEIYDGTHYLCSYDSLTSPSKSYFDYLLDSKLDAINCDQKYVVMDSCHSGGMIPEVQAIGRNIMSACLYDEWSLEDQTYHNGVFTYYFLQSFSSAPDSNGDGVISFDESFAYLDPQVVSRSNFWGYTHHPQNYNGIGGGAILTPAFANLTLTPSGENLTYSFTLCGTGLVEKLSIRVTTTIPDIKNKTVDLTLSSTTSTGFETYSGNVTLEGATIIQAYALYAEIWGRQILMLNKTVGYSDSDGDGIDDLIENISGMNPSSTDTDGDGLGDFTEFYGLSDPRYTDTDGDGLGDYDEVITYLTDPSCVDTDRDKMDDYFEVLYGFNPLSNTDAHLDADNDGLENYIECQMGSNPLSSDTDSDGMPDGWEYDYGLNLIVNDAEEDKDADGLNNLGEYTHDTDPTNPDSDGDLWSDGFEVTWWTDPLNPLSSGISVILNFAGIGIGAAIALIVPRKYKKHIKSNKKLDGKFKLKQDTRVYNVLDVEKIKKPVLPYTSPAYSGYGRPALSSARTPITTMPTYSEGMGDEYKRSLIIDIIKHQLPPPYPPYSPEGKRAMILGQTALASIETGNTVNAINSMLNALKLGVPEPLNSQFKSILLELVREKPAQTQPDIPAPTVYEDICPSCGTFNKSGYRFCINCGHDLEG